MKSDPMTQRVTLDQVGALIVTIAERFVGLTEIRPNAEWDDAATPGPDPRARELVNVLKFGGWEPGAAYCASFVRGCWLLALAELGAPKEVVQSVRRRLSPSVMQTFERNRDAVTKIPVIGSMMLLQKGQTPQGHAGIVVAANAWQYWTIDANTSGTIATAEKEREGEGIFRKPPRRLDFTRRPGLWLRGFIPPPTW